MEQGRIKISRFCDDYIKMKLSFFANIQQWENEGEIKRFIFEIRNRELAGDRLHSSVVLLRVKAC